MISSITVGDVSYRIKQNEVRVAVKNEYQKYINMYIGFSCKCIKGCSNILQNF